MLVKIEMIDSEIREAVAVYIHGRYGTKVDPLDIRIHAKLNSKAGENPMGYREADIRIECSIIAVAAE